VWPESSYPYRMDRDPLPMRSRDPKLRQGFTTPLLFGAITDDDEHEFPFNSALMVNREGMITGRYDKIFLLMFGEYIPLARTFHFIRKIVPATAGMFERGSKVGVFDLPDVRAPGGAWRLGPLICYEDILPGFGRAAAKLHPHVFVNITNDAWFGATSEPWEHLALAVYRSVEHRTGMVRAVQTGVSAFVDATGRIRKHTRAIDPPKGVYTPPDTLIDDVAMLEAGHTFYAGPGSLWGLADLVGILCLGGLLWPLSLGTRDWWRQRRARKQRG
jgi:apolipoprotein N-acyltransferase